ncbi:peptidyl-prolyl cis-trans isomerase FKBP8-like [Paramacrobiotus metropolitanus]|uniref:peptidyl-prolyl cis-trans isomerase FKBP8-like n=1 Tax=Paramacrobiotus metropolitanus TaxID=2943436 RepID=UPI0024462425|nr:peptidyl-prolyl cis-trans isomerase FKBP8-like [Paramacrobiotus metropolitanus]
MDQENTTHENDATATHVRDDHDQDTSVGDHEQGDVSKQGTGDAEERIEDDPVLQDLQEPSSGESGDTVIRNDNPRSRSPGSPRFQTPAKGEQHPECTEADETPQSPEYHTGTTVRDDPSFDDSAFTSPVSDESLADSGRTEDFFSPVMKDELEEAEVHGDGYRVTDNYGNAELLRTISGGDAHTENVEGVSESCPVPYVPDLKPAEVARETTTVIRDTDVALATAKAEEKLAEAESEWQDLVGNGQLMKKILRQGKPDSRPERGDEASVQCSARVVDNAFDTSIVATIVDKYDKLDFVVGDQEVIPGLDLAVQLMNIGEVAEVKMQPRFGYGEMGYPESGIPSDATLLYTVELLSAKRLPDAEHLPLADRLRMANNKVDRGNFWYLRKETTSALGLYQKAVHLLEAPVGTYMTPEDVAQMGSAKARAYGNLSSAQVEEKIWDQSLQSVNNALKYDPNNGKILCRKIRIYREKGDYDLACEACEDVFQKGALVGESFSKKAREEYATLRKKKQKSDADQKAMYQRMLGGAAKQSNGSNRSSRAASSSPPPVNSASPRTWMIVAGATAVAVLGVAIWYRYYQHH